MSLFMQGYDESFGKLYYRTRSSLISALKECVEDLKKMKTSSNISFFDFDCHAEVHELPQKDLLGLKSFSFYDDSGVIEMSTFIVCSTMDDDNGLRLSKIIGYVFSRFAGTKAIKIINETQKHLYSIEIKSGVEVMPMSKSDGRMVQYIDVTGNISHSFL